MLKDTPVEKHKLNGREILVKRDDLMGDGNVLPPWGKMAGIDAILETLNPKKPLIHLAVNGSWSGWALSYLCKQRGIKFIYAYPPSKTYSQFILDKAKENGCEFHELKPNMMAILYNRVNSYARRNDIQMLPYAFDHENYRKNLKQRAEEVFREHLVDHLVISAGSGVTSAGVVEAFQPGNDVYSNSNKQAHIITVSNINTIYEKYKSHSITSSSIHVDKTKYEFDDMMTDYEVPFPCNGTWDRKAWWWLEQMESQLKGDILFWNIGGNI
ncbi:MAG: hypothetical protein H8D92_00635 [Pelagibacteraceae bacterium]|nr:hypothetical protein [Pelagibacteraceae bacterium]